MNDDLGLYIQRGENGLGEDPDLLNRVLLLQDTVGTVYEPEGEEVSENIEPSKI